MVTKKASGPILTTPPVLPGPPIGAEVPDFQLRNQNDEPIRLRQFKGRAVILTFIYTRCPLPDFCPLMMKHFDAINRQLASRPDLAQRVTCSASASTPSTTRRPCSRLMERPS